MPASVHVYYRSVRYGGTRRPRADSHQLPLNLQLAPLFGGAMFLWSSIVGAPPGGRAATQKNTPSALGRVALPQL